jgi:hypothetical protein
VDGRFNGYFIAGLGGAAVALFSLIGLLYGDRDALSPFLIGVIAALMGFSLWRHEVGDDTRLLPVVAGIAIGGIVFTFIAVRLPIATPFQMLAAAGVAVLSVTAWITLARIRRGGTGSTRD